MSETTTEDDAEVQRVLAEDDGSHGPGDLDNLPESNTNLEVESD